MPLKPSHPTRGDQIPETSGPIQLNPELHAKAVGKSWAGAGVNYPAATTVGTCIDPLAPSATARGTVRGLGRPASMVPAGMATPRQHTLGGNPRVACQHKPIPSDPNLSSHRAWWAKGCRYRGAACLSVVLRCNVFDDIAHAHGGRLDAIRDPTSTLSAAFTPNHGHRRRSTEGRQGDEQPMDQPRSNLESTLLVACIAQANVDVARPHGM
ncbi:hypothetical protein DE4585_03892 [Mycobacteroides salmoniphilum]|uniref:Uncharacterized protein n=1 Tax=Mycobacteroides salmoniphilum TaxID=404941 RepID=A0A4R8S007_9MYCO|nr:hypothetical protein DE4585_03892 [Mycobacteroides salmoniphilum]